MPQSRKIQGIAVCPGLAIGEVHVISAGPERTPVWTVPGEELAREIGRLASAVTVAMEALRHSQELVARETGEKDAEIFAVHRMILQDPSALQKAESIIRDQRVNAEGAVQMLIDDFEETMGRLEGDSVRSYAADVSDPWRRVLDALRQSERDEIQGSEQKVVLAAAELTPQVMTYLPRERILGVLTEAGGRFSHGAVLARSFGVPTVSGLPNLLARLEQGMLVTVDGDAGEAQLRPREEDVEDFLARRQRLLERREEVASQAALPAETTDGEVLDVQVNVCLLYTSPSPRD